MAACVTLPLSYFKPFWGWKLHCLFLVLLPPYSRLLVSLLARWETSPVQRASVRPPRSNIVSRTAIRGGHLASACADGTGMANHRSRARAAARCGSLPVPPGQDPAHPRGRHHPTGGHAESAPSGRAAARPLAELPPRRGRRGGFHGEFQPPIPRDAELSLFQPVVPSVRKVRLGSGARIARPSPRAAGQGEGSRAGAVRVFSHEESHP